jgi:TonB-linked SusC/RagA family outer membrane protein
MKQMLGLPSLGRGMHGCAMYLLLLSFLLVISNVVRAQDPDVEILNKRVSYHASKQPLSRVLKEIRTLTNVRFTYNNDVIRKQGVVTVNQKTGTLEDLLKQVLLNTGLDFGVDMGGIVIYPKIQITTQSISVSFLVRGQVVTAGGDPLQGATVQALGSKDGTVTTENGIFSLMVTDKEPLRVSLLGMKTVVYIPERKDAEFVKIALDTAAQAIQEVVVNGYQKIDARMSTAAIFKLSAAELIQPGQPSIDKMLQGKVPGLMLINTSGSVNARPTIRIRGTSTFVGNASPLWVIDDVVRPDPVDLSATQLNNVVSDAQGGNFSLIGNAISGINPYDVESITFLKDAAATAIYGVRAANGVIVVTTKRGKAGPVQVNYNTSFSFQQRPSYTNLQLMNSKERVTLSKELLEDGVTFNSAANGFKENISYEGLLQALYAHKITNAEFKTRVADMETRNTDWFKMLFRNAFNMTHSINMSGGNGKTTYYTSVSYSDNAGAAQQDSRKAYTGDMALHSEVNKRLSVDVNLIAGYSKSGGYFPGVNPLTYALQTNRGISKEDVYPLSAGHSSFQPTPGAITFNMLKEIAQTENNASIRSLIAKVGLNYKIRRGLFFRSTASATLDASESMTAANEGSFYASDQRGWNLGYEPSDKQVAATYLPYGGVATMANQNSTMIYLRNMLEYNQPLFKERDQFILTLGNEIISTQMKGVSSTEPGYFPDRGQTFFATDFSRRFYSRHTIVNGLTNTLSMLATAVYSINNKYVISGTVRTDGSNRFGQYSNAKFLPNFGLSGKWNVTNEHWLQNNRFISGLDFRASLGTQGNVVNSVGPELIATYPTSGRVDPLTGIPFLGIKTLPYPDLRWEKTYQWNFGTDLSLLDSRINLSVDYYVKKSKDLLVQTNIAYEYGIDNMYKNGGTLLNQGLEMILQVELMRRKFTSLSLRFINSRNFNQIQEQEFTNSYESYLSGDAFVPGKPVSGFYSYAYKGLSPQTGLPLFNKQDEKNRVDTMAAYLVYSGQLHPVFTGSFSSSFRYKNFSINADFYYALGGHRRLNSLFLQERASDGVPTPFSNATAELLGRWRKPGDEQYTDVPAIREGTSLFIPGTGLNVYDAYNKSDLRVANSSYIRCKNIQFNYQVPVGLSRKAGIKGITTGIFCSNLFTIASKELKGQDPEIDGAGTTALPVTRQYGFNMSVNF